MISSLVVRTRSFAYKSVITISVRFAQNNDISSLGYLLFVLGQCHTNQT